MVKFFEYGIIEFDSETGEYVGDTTVRIPVSDLFKGMFNVSDD